MVNNCANRAGMLQYAKWSATARGGDPDAAKADHFYGDAWAQNVFKNFLAVLTSRVNTITGVAYRRGPHNIHSNPLIASSHIYWIRCTDMQSVRYHQNASAPAASAGLCWVHSLRHCKGPPREAFRLSSQLLVS